jgi:organic hydroperoxide reductase OsmC/OhrA
MPLLAAVTTIAGTDRGVIALPTVTENRPTTRAKEFAFPVTVDWLGGRRVAARVEGKQPVTVAPPTVFRGDDPSIWSPEDLLVGAAASCLAVTFTGLAERDGLAYTGLEVAGNGVCSMRSDGRFGFIRLPLHLVVEAAEADAGRARALVEKAEATCLVSASLDVPVETLIDVRSPAA